jgi:hypothetical protein
MKQAGCSIGRFATLVGISKSHAHALVKHHLVPSIKLGCRTIIPITWIEERFHCKLTGSENTRIAYSVEEFADLAGIGRTLAYELARNGKVDVVRLGKRILVPLFSIENIFAAGYTLFEDIRPATHKEVRP